MTEEDLLAQAIALSLESEGAPVPNPSTPGEGDSQESGTEQSETQEVPASEESGNWELTVPCKRDRQDSGVNILAETSQAVVPGSGGSGTTLPAVRLSSIHSYSQWQPNRECLELVMGMGISENAARRALYNTGNDNAELAVAWVFENIENPELHQPFDPLPVTAPQRSDTGPVYHSYDELVSEEELAASKMVFVVNMELEMGVGKIAAQVGHATLGLYRLLQRQTELHADVKQWEEAGSKKIVVKGDSVQHLLDLKRKAYELRLPNVIVHDAGLTQVEPGSLTVFAIFGKVLQVDQVTGKLKLL